MAKASKLGPVAIFAAKLVFLGAGYVGIAVLSRALTTEQFGTYSVVMGAVALINMVLINGTMQTVSRFVAAHPEAQAGVRRRAFLYQAGFATVVVGGVLLGADMVAAFLNDASVAPLLRLAMAITGIYAFYAINVGYLNGRKQFVRQAALDIFFSVTKWTSMIALAVLGYAVEGVIGGFALAALLVFLLSFALVGKGAFSGEPAPVSPRAFVGFAFSVMGVALLLNAMLQADLFLLKRLTEAAASDTAAGLYGAAQQVSRIPYYLMATASLVLFPMVASLRSHDEAGRARAADAVSQAWTAVFGLVVGMAAVTVPITGRVLSVLYPEKYLVAAGALQWLIVALITLTMVNISVTMISGAGKPRVSVIILVVGLAVQAAAAHYLIPAYGMTGAAIATAIAGVICLGLATAWLATTEGLRVPLRVPVVVALGAAVSAGLTLGFDAVAPDSRILTVAFSGLAYLVYLVVLLMGGVLLGARAGRGRVLLVTKPIAPPFNDGSKVLARGVLDALDSTHLAVLSTKAGRRELAANYEGLEVAAIYSNASSFLGRNLQNLRVFLFLLTSRFNYRALHFFFAPNRTTCRAIRIIKLLSPGVRFVQTVQSRPRSYDDAGGLLFGDVVTAHSEDTARRLREASGRDVEVVRPGLPPLEPDRSRAAALKSRGLDPDALHLLFAGDVDEGGALANLEVLVPAILDAVPEAHFHLSIRRKTADSEARARGLLEGPLAPFASRVSTWVDDEDFRGLLDLQDAMLFPQEELIAKVDAPLVILETLQRGRPVFMLRRPAIDELGPESLRDALSADDAAGLAERVIAWSQNHALIDADALRADVAERFSSTTSAARYGALHG